MDLIFFGMQGAGKGTLGRAIADEFGLQIFETGAELRKLSQEDSELGNKIKSIIEAGHLVSNEVVMEIVEDFIIKLNPGIAVLFDGIPRSVEQAHSLNDLLQQNNRQFTGVLIEISKATALERLTTRRIDPVTKKVYPQNYPSDISEDGNKLVTRKDDQPEAIENRLNAFEQETIPAINLYKDLIVIDGEPPIEIVRNEAIEKLTTLFS